MTSLKIFFEILGIPFSGPSFFVKKKSCFFSFFDFFEKFSIRSIKNSQNAYGEKNLKKKSRCYFFVTFLKNAKKRKKSKGTA
jgi:hypothetical protein